MDGWINVYVATEQMLRPWSQQARQLTLRRRTVAHLGDQGCSVHIHTGVRLGVWGVVLVVRVSVGVEGVVLCRRVCVCVTC